MNNNRLDDLIIENARIMYRNFSGKPSKYNTEGMMNFCLVIPDAELADRLRDDGWNIKVKTANDEYEDDLYYTQVAVRFDRIPPNILMITKKKRTRLDNEESVKCLDWAEIETVDVIVHPSRYTNNGGGVKGYLKSMYVTIREDVFADKYAEEEYPE